MKKLVLVALAAVLLSGCAANVQRPQGQVAVKRVVVTPAQQVAKVSLSMTEEAKKKSLSNLKLNTDALLSHVRRAMEAHQLVDATGDQPRPSVEIVLKDMRIRSTFTAIFWGVFAGPDSVSADVVIKDAEGKELDRYGVAVSYALGGYMGMDDARMSWLYENFAAQVVKEMTRPLEVSRN